MSLGEEQASTMIDFAPIGMHEINGVLVHKLNGMAIQVRLEKDNVDVHYRELPSDKMNDTESEEPKWITAYGDILAEWRSSNSAVWQWLKKKGLDETASAAKQLKLR
jgi:hypothetical protein